MRVKCPNCGYTFEVTEQNSQIRLGGGPLVTCPSCGFTGYVYESEVDYLRGIRQPINERTMPPGPYFHLVDTSGFRPVGLLDRLPLEARWLLGIGLAIIIFLLLRD